MPDFSNPTNNNLMEKFDSISHFLQTGDFDYRVFDLGRKVMPVSNDVFQAIENQQQVYPFPFQQKAWLALLFWQTSQPDEAVIWFLQFPIDELGFLKQEARDAFLIDLLEQTGKNIQAKQAGTQVLDELAESPFAFKPREDRQALFHALATQALDQEPSPFYAHAQDYLTGQAGFDRWQFLGLQGIADVVVRLDQAGNDALLVGALSQMPVTPLEFFCHALENIRPSAALQDVLYACLDSHFQSQVSTIAALVRALSGIALDGRKDKVLRQVLASEAGADIEVLAAISAKSWLDLKAPSLLKMFIEKLAMQDQAGFNAILADLMMMPEMRELILKIMRSPERSDAVAEKLGGFMALLSG